jgi:hypothetical protein
MDPSGQKETDSMDEVDEWYSFLCGIHFHSVSSFDDDDEPNLKVLAGIRTEILNWLNLMPTSV